MVAPQSIVLHNLEVSHVKSTFPVSLGAFALHEHYTPVTDTRGPKDKYHICSPVCRPPPLTGARITGVDDKTYSSTGESFSNIILPHSESNATRKLQADDVSLAYEVSQLSNTDLLRPEQRPHFPVLTTTLLSLSLFR